MDKQGNNGSNSAAVLCDALAAKHRRHTGEGNRKGRQDHPRASDLNPCAREGYYQITEWKARPDFPIETLERFARGHEIERLVIGQLMREGWTIIEQQLPFEIREDIDGVSQVIMTGHCDGRIEFGGSNPLFEVKSLISYVWNRIDCAADFMKLGSFWHRYPLQLAAYCYGMGEDYGIFILDDCMGHLKFVPVVVEEWLDPLSKALDRCRAAVKGKIDGVPPPFIADPVQCSTCWCRSAGVCFPPMDFSNMDTTSIIDDVDLAENLGRLTELKEARDEWEGIDKGFKTRMKAEGAGSYVVGPFLVQVKTSDRKAYDVPDCVKELYPKKGSTMTKTTFERIDHRADMEAVTNGTQKDIA